MPWPFPTILRRSEMETTCSFCKGKGKDPFELLSSEATCQVCGGTGTIHVKEPAKPCIFCTGTGNYPNSRLTCTVCSGKGYVTIPALNETCIKCGGTGTEFESKMPCSTCMGLGLVKTQESTDSYAQV